MENTATARQRWALFCITKKDYRNEILSKEEACRLIKELGNSNYVKKAKSIKSELLEFLKAHIDELYNCVRSELGYKSVVTIEGDNKPRNYTMIGFGCGITYLQYRKNNKKAEEINKAAAELRSNEIFNLIQKKFSKKELKELENCGCPLGAIWYQMMNIQSAYYYLIKDFAKTKGIKMDVISRLD